MASSTQLKPRIRVESAQGTSVGWTRDGASGNADTVARLIAKVRRDSVYDLGIEKLAAQILIDARLDSHSPAAQNLEAIFSFVKSHVTYIRDPYGKLESIKDARQVLSDGFGDCDDLSVCLATLLACVGFKPFFVCAKYRRATNGFDHIYCACVADNVRYALDATPKDKGFNWEAPALDKRDIDIFGGTDIDVQLAGWTDIFNSVAKVGVGLIPVGGALFSNYLQTKQQNKLVLNAVSQQIEQARAQISAQFEAIMQAANIAGADLGALIAQANELTAQWRAISGQNKDFGATAQLLAQTRTFEQKVQTLDAMRAQVALGANPGTGNASGFEQSGRAGFDLGNNPLALAGIALGGIGLIYFATRK